jgi:prepilin-type N-terminal cleavage/methylation domain-containing protein
MKSASVGHLAHRHDTKGGHRPEGFSLLEMMMVVTLILIVASIAGPTYMTCATTSSRCAS